MNLLQTIGSYFKPVLVGRYPSKTQGQLEVRYSQHQYSFVAKGAVQAGGVAHRRFQLTLNALCARTPRFQPQTCLILGYGSGDFANLLINRWPKLKITGVDLDSEIVKLGQRYFQKRPTFLPCLQIADAFTYIHIDPNHYDLIFIDLYQGFTIPSALNSLKFLRTIKNHMHAQSQAIINYFSSVNHPNHYQRLVRHLSQVFPHFYRSDQLQNQVYYLAI